MDDLPDCPRPRLRIVRWRTALVALPTAVDAEQKLDDLEAIRALLLGSDRSRRSDLELTAAALLALRHPA